MNDPYYHQDRKTRNESIPQSQRRSHHQSQYSVDSADQGAGGYRFGSFRGSENSGGSGAFRAGKRPDSEQQQHDYQQRQQQQIRHDDGVTNANFTSHASERTNRRQPHQQRLSGTNRASTSSRRTSVSSSSTSRGAEQLNQSLSESHGSLNPQEMSRQRRGHGGRYNDNAFSSRRQNRMQNLQSQSLTPTRRQNRAQNLQSQSLPRSTKLQTNKEEEEEDDEFDTIPLVSNEYLKELTARSATTQMNNDESETNHVNPNNNNDNDVSNSFQDGEYSTLSQSVRIAAMRSSGDNEMPHHRRASQTSSASRHSFTSNQSRPHQRRTSQESSASRNSFTSNQSMPQGSIGRHSFNPNQRSQTRQAGLNRSFRQQQQRQKSNRMVSSSLNETQLRRNSRSVPDMSPLFYSQRRQSTGDVGGRVNYDISGVPLRHSNVVGGGGYDNEVVTAEQQEGIILNKNPPESMLAHAQYSTDVRNGGTIGNKFGFIGNFASDNLNNDVSASLVKKKKVRFFGAIGVCLIVVIVIVVVIVYITTSQSSDDEPKQIQPQMPLPENDSEVALECKDCVSKPVPDIEGRCSPSNLPGSLSECKEACKQAACCYSNFEGEKCYDDSNEATLLACGQYRPHCDVIHRPWPGASKGLIPDAPTSLFEGSDWDEICGSGASARKLSTNNSSQALTCIEFCLPSKCCFAPIVQSDLTSQGLLLNQDGAYQSVEKYEYIMTSCTPKNYNSCLDYDDACGDLIIPLSFWQDAVVLDLSSMSFPPSASITPSTSTRRPTLQPTTERPTTQTPTKEVAANEPAGKVDNPTREPTSPPPTKGVTSTSPPTSPPTSLPPAAPTIVVPIADLAKIRESCTGFQNYNLIAKGEFNTRTKCRNACSDGLCCFVDLGLGIEKNCFEGNEDVCALYSDCLVLRAKPSDVLDEDSNSIGPSTPIDDLTSLCSSEAIGTPVGISNCFQACLPGSWCCGATGEASCFNEFEESCSAYGPCQLMVDKWNGDSNQAMPPIPPNSVQHACSYPALSAFHQSDGNVITECNRICDAGMCCMDGTCGEGTSIETAIADRCAAYEPCRHLLQLPTPPDDMETLCKDKESSQCLDACLIASCCWLSNDDGCFASFEERCLVYAPYCSPNMSETGDFPAPLSPPPPNLCMSGPPSACRNACKAGPSCCFSPLIEDNCFSQNEEVSPMSTFMFIVASSVAYSHVVLFMHVKTCGMWARCAPFYQEDVEIL